MSIGAFVRRRRPPARQRGEHLRQEHAICRRTRRARFGIDLLRQGFGGPSESNNIGEESQIEIAHPPRVRGLDDRRLHAAGRVREVGTKQSRTRQVHGHAHPYRSRVGLLYQRRDPHIGRRAKLEAEDAVEAKGVGSTNFVACSHAVTGGVGKLTPGARRERPQPTTAKRKNHLCARVRKFFQDGLRRDERISAVVPLAGEHQHAAGGGKRADFLKITQGGRGDRPARPLHGRPFLRLVAAK